MTSSTNPAATPGTSDDQAARLLRKLVRGVVKSNKMQKTLVIEVNRKVRHPLYEKYVSRRTKLYAHDEKGEANIGDVVEVMQTRPMSRLKRWRLVRVVQRAPAE